VTNPALSKQAAFQKQEGGARAIEAKAREYAGFMGQIATREGDLTRGASDGVDYALNILKSAADSITQTVTSMFRG
jgi:hypothetical protein